MKEKCLDQFGQKHSPTKFKVQPDYSLLNSANMTKRNFIDQSKMNQSTLMKNRRDLGYSNSKFLRKGSIDNLDRQSLTARNTNSIASPDMIKHKREKFANSRPSSSGKRPTSSQSPTKEKLNPGSHVGFKNTDSFNSAWLNKVGIKLHKNIQNNSFMNTTREVSRDRIPTTKTRENSIKFERPLSNSFDNNYAEQATEIVNFIDKKNRNITKDNIIKVLKRAGSQDINPYDSQEGYPIGELQTGRLVSAISIFPSDLETAEENKKYEEHNPQYPYEGYAVKLNPPKPTTFIMPHFNYLLTCDWDGIIKQWDHQTLDLHRTYDEPSTKGARAIAITKNSKHIFVGDMGGGICHYTVVDDAHQNPSLFFIAKHKEHSHAIRVMAITHDDTFLLTACSGGIVKQFYIHPIAKCLMIRRNWGEFFKFSCHVTAIAITYDNEYAFIGDKDGILRQFC